ncbi:MAG: DUF3168 domain-containing protein [Micavibrio sp.]|nr:DUF3168 domain-containing protein [Micavibrio sp.]
MSAQSLWPVQAAVYARLSGDEALGGLLPANRIFDAVPADSPFPYIALGDMSARAADTQGTSGYDITLDIDAYSRGTGMKEARALMRAVYDCLHNQSFTVEGQTLLLCLEVESSCSLLADGRTRRSTQRFHLVTEPV